DGRDEVGTVERHTYPFIGSRPGDEASGRQTSESCRVAGPWTIVGNLAMPLARRISIVPRVTVHRPGGVGARATRPGPQDVADDALHHPRFRLRAPARGTTLESVDGRSAGRPDAHRQPCR